MYHKDKQSDYPIPHLRMFYQPPGRVASMFPKFQASECMLTYVKLDLPGSTTGPGDENVLGSHLSMRNMKLSPLGRWWGL